MVERKERLIELIKKYHRGCPDCGKEFLGAALEGSSKYSVVHVGIISYPLSCGKCPSCAQNCFNTKSDVLRRDGGIPCCERTFDEYDEDEDFETIGNNFAPELDCWMYCDEKWDTYESVSSTIIGGKLIDLFEILESHLQD